MNHQPRNNHTRFVFVFQGRSEPPKPKRFRSSETVEKVVEHVVSTDASSNLNCTFLQMQQSFLPVHPSGRLFISTFHPPPPVSFKPALSSSSISTSHGGYPAEAETGHTITGGSCLSGGSAPAFCPSDRRHHTWCSLSDLTSAFTFRNSSSVANRPHFVHHEK